MDLQIQQEITTLMKEFERIAANVRRDRKAVLKASAQILINEIKFRAPISKKPHKRYSSSAINKGRRAAKGSGVVVATYKPGNLRFSFSTLNLHRTSAVFVGAKLDKSGLGGVYNSSANADGYYAHMVEKGTKYAKKTPFVAPALQSAGPHVLNDMARRLSARINRIKKIKENL